MEMTRYSKNQYQLGIKHWNRNQIIEAKYCFDQIVNNLDIFDSYEKEKLSEFYERVEDTENLTKVLNHMIKNKENLSSVVKKYLSIKESDIDEKELRSIERLRELKLNIDIKYELAKIYYSKENFIKCYELIASILDYIEFGNKGEFSKELYVSCLLKMIELEYKFDNFTQARFQARKLINRYIACSEDNEEKIIYWSVVLNIFQEVVEKNNWVGAINNIKSKELRTLVYVMIQILKGEVNERIYTLLNASVFEDVNLKYRAKVILIYLKKCSGDISWMEDLEFIDIKRCYLSVLLEYEKRKQRNEVYTEDAFEKYYKYHLDIPQILNVFWNSKSQNVEKSFEDVSINFIGGADGIGGSAVLVSYKSFNILLDAGANINNSEYSPNFNAMKETGVDIKDIDYLIISHGHLDHTGVAPILYKQNPNLKIISTAETKDIMKVMLEDTVKINGQKLSNLFDSQDIKNLLSNIDVQKFETEIRLKDDVSMTLYRAGHILGAASIHLKLGETNILYTGDYSVQNQETVEGIQLPDELGVDILITESTYAYQPTNFDLPKTYQEELLIDEIKKTVADNGVVLIPAFAVGRAQEIVLLIKKYFKDDAFLPFDLYIDGKVVEVCSIYEKSKLGNKFKSIYGNGISTVNERYRGDNEIPINKFKGSCVIASSGMLNEGSRSSKYASTIIGDEESLILFSGYLDEESPGNQIVKEMQNNVFPKVKLEGVTREVKCDVKSYKLSAHVKKNEILKLIAQLKPRCTFLVHGDVYNKYKYFGSEEIGREIYPEIEDTLKYLSKDCSIIKPKNGEIFNLKDM